MIDIHELLESLKLAFESKNIRVTDCLLPPLSMRQIIEDCEWYPDTLPDEIIQLYTWSGGQDPYGENLFIFRDVNLLSLGQAKIEYEIMIQTRAAEGFVNGINLKYCFPFAAADGSRYLLPSERHGLLRNMSRPVLQAFHDESEYFSSFRSMLRTCIEWVGHPKYDESPLWGMIEHEIWIRNNPDIIF